MRELAIIQPMLSTVNQDIIQKMYIYIIDIYFIQLLPYNKSSLKIQYLINIKIKKKLFFIFY